MATVNWTPRVRLKGGAECEYLGKCVITGKHRVFDPRAGQNGTVWLIDDQGRCRGDLAPSDYDYAAAA